MEKQTLKLGVFLITTLFLSFWLGRTTYKFLLNPFLLLTFSRQTYAFFLKIIWLLATSALVFPLPALFLKPKKALLSGVLINALAFTSGVSWPVPAGLGKIAGFLAFLFAIFLFLFFKRARDQSEKYILFLPKDIFSSPIGNFLTSLVFVFSLGFFFSLKTMVAAQEFEIPESLIRKLAEPAVSVLEKQLGAQIERQFGERFQKTIGTAEKRQILEFLKSQLKETAEEGQVRQEFGFTPQNLNLDKMQIDEEGNLDLSLAIDDFIPEIKKELDRTIRPYLSILPFVFALLLFLSLKTIASLLMLILPFLIQAEFRILTSLGVLKLVEEERKVERLSL